MTFSHYKKPISRATADTTPSRTLRTSHIIRLLAYSVVLNCVLGVLQPSIIGVSAAPAPPKPIYPENLEVVDIGGSLRRAERGFALYGTANEPHRGLVLERRRANDTVGSVQSSAEPITSLVADITKDQSLPVFPTPTETGDRKETKIPEALTTQSVGGQITKGTGDQSVPSLTTELTGKSTGFSVPNNLESQTPDKSLQSSPSATEEKAQGPTTENVGGSQPTGKESSPTIPTVPSIPAVPSIPILPSIPTALVPAPVSSPIVSRSVKTPNFPATTPPTETSSQEVPETTPSSGTTLAPDGSVRPTASVGPATLESTASVAAPPQNTPVSESSVQDLPATTATPTPVFVPGVGTIISGVSSILGPVKEIASVTSPGLEIPLSSTAQPSDANVTTIPTPTPSVSLPSENGTGGDTGTTAQSSPVDSSQSITIPSRDNSASTATPKIPDTQSPPATATGVAPVEIPAPSASPEPSQPQLSGSTIPTATTTTDSALVSSIITEITEPVATSVTADVTAPITTITTATELEPTAFPTGSGTLITTPEPGISTGSGNITTTPGPGSTDISTESNVSTTTPGPEATNSLTESEIPAATSGPEATDIPAESGTTATTQGPGSTNISTTTPGPEATNSLTESKIPATTSGPEATDIAAESGTINTTQGPGSTDISTESKISTTTQATNSLTESEIPATTSGPEATDIPAESGTTTATQVPGSTDTLTESKTSTTTPGPEATNSPTASGVSATTPEPEAATTNPGSSATSITQAVSPSAEDGPATTSRPESLTASEPVSTNAPVPATPVLTTTAANTTISVNTAISTTSSLADPATTNAITTEESIAIFSTVVLPTPSSGVDQNSTTATGSEIATPTKTAETLENADSASAPPIALESAVAIPGLSNATTTDSTATDSTATDSTATDGTATDPMTTLITTTSETTESPATPGSSLPTDFGQIANESPSPVVSLDSPETTPTVASNPVTLVEVVVPITRASDIPPSAEVTAGTSVDKDGNKVEILAFYDATSGETFGSDRSTVFDGGAVGLDVPSSFILAMIAALVGHLFFL